jgi:hypothetical protein
MSELTTSTGYKLKVRRIPRARIDAFLRARPEPEPPTREVEAFGGVVEEVPVLDDPEYVAALQAHRLEMGLAQLDLITDAVEIEGTGWEHELSELHELGLTGDNPKVDVLRYVVLGNDADFARVVEEVLYNSTVTLRGLEEAAEWFAVTWLGQRVPVVSPPTGPGRASNLFGDRQAAKFSLLTWKTFCALSGPEQSAAVAFHRLSMKMEERAVKHQQAKQGR